jgi:diacylglycerol kinase family enzyme
MHFHAILNSHGGTLRTTDLEALSAHIQTTLTDAGHKVSVDVVEGSEVEDVIRRAARGRKSDALLVGGGDGTISTAASELAGKKKALAILPAGTMNLFARSLGIPQDLPAAVTAFATAETKAVDVGRVDGEVFVHQYSIGLHAKMVHLREQMSYASRLGKIGASAKAAWQTVMNPPSMKVKLTLGDAEIITRTSGIGVTNNLFGEGHLPYADKPDGGILGVYVTIARERSEMLKLAVNMARGKWRDNDQVEIHETRAVKIELLSAYKRFRCVIDGELRPMRKTTFIEIMPGALNVLVPKAASQARAA